MSTSNQEHSTQARLQAIRERVSKITAGEWTWEGQRGVLTSRLGGSVEEYLDTAIISRVLSVPYSGRPSEQDAAFIASAPQTVRWLLDTCERLQAENARLHGQLEHTQTASDAYTKQVHGELDRKERRIRELEREINQHKESK